jgi:hypothetical protein
MGKKGLKNVFCFERYQKNSRKEEVLFFRVQVLNSKLFNNSE